MYSSIKSNLNLKILVYGHYNTKKGILQRKDKRKKLAELIKTMKAEIAELKKATLKG